MTRTAQRKSSLRTLLDHRRFRTMPQRLRRQISYAGFPRCSVEIRSASNSSHSQSKSIAAPDFASLNPGYVLFRLDRARDKRVAPLRMNGDRGDLDLDVARQAGDLDRGAGRRRLLEISGVDL